MRYQIFTKVHVQRYSVQSELLDFILVWKKLYTLKVYFDKKFSCISPGSRSVPGSIFTFSQNHGSVSAWNYWESTRTLLPEYNVTCTAESLTLLCKYKILKKFQQSHWLRCDMHSGVIDSAVMCTAESMTPLLCVQRSQWLRCDLHSGVIDSAVQWLCMSQLSLDLRTPNPGFNPGLNPPVI
jgi:hypothetical protein